MTPQLENTGAFCETFVGTTCYMSPERLSGEAYSYAADIWAFGIIMVSTRDGWSRGHVVIGGHAGWWFLVGGHVIDGHVGGSHVGGVTRTLS